MMRSNTSNERRSAEGCVHPRGLARFLVTAGLLIGAGILVCGPAAGAQGAPEDQALEEIRDLHRRDVEAVRAGDAETLVSIWTRDAVALPPEGPPLQGIEEIRELVRAGVGQVAQLEILEYAQDFRDVTVVGDAAYEWGLYRTRYRDPESGEVLAASGKLLRVLRRSPDGGWQVARSMWTVDVDAATLAEADRGGTVTDVRNEHDRVLETVEAINRCWLEGRTEELGELFHPQLAMAFPGFSGTAQGAEAVIAGFEDFVQNATVEDFRITDELVHVAGTSAVVVLSYDMTFSREGKSFHSTGRDLWVLSRELEGWRAVWRTMLDVKDELIGDSS